MFCIKLKFDNRQTLTTAGQWWWRLSWQSGRLRYQRSTVRIQSSVNFYNEHILLLTVEKTKIKEKEAEDGPYLK